MQGLFSLKKKRYSTQTSGTNFFLSKAHSKGSQVIRRGSKRSIQKKQMSLGDKQSILQRFRRQSGSGIGKFSSSSVMNRRFPSIESESRAVSKLNSTEKFKQMSGFSFCKANSGETNKFSNVGNAEPDEKRKSSAKSPGLFNSCLWKKQTSGVYRSGRRTQELRTLNSKLRSSSRLSNIARRRSNESNRLPQLSKDSARNPIRRGVSKENHRSSKESRQSKRVSDASKFGHPSLSMRLNSINQSDVQQMCRAVFSHAFRQVETIYNIFRSLQEVGSGSYAVAYLAEKKKTREKFVLKTFELRKFSKKSHLNRFMVFSFLQIYFRFFEIYLAQKNLFRYRISRIGSSEFF